MKTILTLVMLGVVMVACENSKATYQPKMARQPESIASKPTATQHGPINVLRSRYDLAVARSGF
ncbi:hypothetical protein MKQ68_00085 [Chitinophaga horti]|uniref:Uncharacterized protein n=1 Tax=Chitinophaga horti TaxID=2920382 RepID=A0ABY6J5I2_9BACT|nr:hypothetical protein [Chitinophaga horti]UYQ93497.1 hypothetical protein MKQ68_00085 [Chitinophaga horti]